MLESKIQRKIICALEGAGWYVIKIIQTNKNGFVDIEAIRKYPEHCYIEVKQPGIKPRPLQLFRINELKKLGWKVIIATSLDDISELIN